MICYDFFLKKNNNYLDLFLKKFYPIAFYNYLFNDLFDKPNF